jgi:hypothetical protein
LVYKKAIIITSSFVPPGRNTGSRFQIIGSPLFPFCHIAHLIASNLLSLYPPHDAAALCLPCYITFRCRDVPEPDQRSPSPWRCLHPVKECGVLQGLLFQEPNPGLRPCTLLRRLLCYTKDSLLLRPLGGVKAGVPFSFNLLC